MLIRGQERVGGVDGTGQDVGHGLHEGSCVGVVIISPSSICGVELGRGVGQGVQEGRVEEGNTGDLLRHAEKRACNTYNTTKSANTIQQQINESSEI